MSESYVSKGYSPCIWSCWNIVITSTETFSSTRGVFEWGMWILSLSFLPFFALQTTHYLVKGHDCLHAHGSILQYKIMHFFFFFFHLKLSISSLKHSNLIGYIITCQHTIRFYIILLRKCPSICTSIVPLWLFIKNSLNMWLPTEVFIYSLLYEKVLGWSFSHCASGIVYCVICLVVIWVQTLNYYYSCFVSDIRFQFNCVLKFIQYI